MEYTFLLVLAVILLSTKLFGLLSRRVHMPQVVGALLAGIVLGPTCLNWIGETDFLVKTSELGVIMLMFLAGLDTDMEELKKTGVASFVIALIGVIVPLIGGYVTYDLFFREAADPQHVLKAIFIGVVLTATSVSITVETLREMGRLKGKVGTAILGAAIIDDIMGIIILTIVTSFTDPSVNPVSVLVRLLSFFVFLFIVGFIMYRVFKKFDKDYANRRRLAIYGFAFCLLMAFISEHFFGIADITGAYFAGLILCNIAKTRDYIAKKINIASYMIFSPIFFASIGIKTTVDGMNFKILVFTIILLLVALLTKVVGCGLGAKMCRFTNHESLCVGIGMISRGEVALIVAQKGAEFNLVNPVLFPAVVVVVIVTTLITPILLKIAMSKDAIAQDDSPENPLASHS